MTDLATFIEAKGTRRPRCGVCKLPSVLRTEIHQALLHRPDLSHQRLVDYLAETGHPVTLGQLQGHLRCGHLAGYVKRR